MATYTPKPLVQQEQFTNADSALYTSPTGITTVIKAASVFNEDTAVHTLTINKVPSGGASAANNQIAAALAIPAQTSIPLPQLFNAVLGPGDMIRGVADVTLKVNLNLDGYTVV